MLTQTHWKETFEFEPWNPDQMKALHYTGLPGGYSTFYYNRVPITTGLVGPVLPQPMSSNETVSIVPPVFGAAAEGYTTSRMIFFAALAVGLGAAAGYVASRVF